MGQMEPKHRIGQQQMVIIGAVGGAIVTFVVITGLAQIGGLSWSSSVGVAGLSTVFSGWYLGVIVALSRRGGFGAEDADQTGEEPAPTDDAPSSSEHPAGV
jgi:hypothetical protein